MSTRREVICSAIALAFATEQTVSQPALFELRAYATAPGRRDDLIDMFDREFLDAYEAGGARVLGAFRDIDEPDRWVWMRAFSDARDRGTALNNFYSSAVWQRLRDPANATIADTSNVLLLRLASGRMPDAFAETPKGGRASLILSCVHVVSDGAEKEFAELFASLAAPRLRDLQGEPFAAFVTDRSENFFPRQAVRKESVFVTLTRFESREACEAFIARRDASPAWRADVAPRLQRLQAGPVETMRLAPTARSRTR